MTTANTTTNPGGSIPWVIGESIDPNYLEAMGSIGLQSLTSLLGRLAQISDNPIDGFVGATDCKVTASGLVATIAPGWGFQYRASLTGAYVPSYLPIVVSATHNQPITAHHATLKRHDLIGIKAAYDEDQPVVRSVYDVTGSGGWTSPMTDKRSRWSYEVAYITGTPGTAPSDPAMTSGYLTIARLRVPATAGAVTVDDLRPYWRFARELAEDPGAEYAAPFIPGTGTECQVIESATPAMTVIVSEGKSVGLGGYRSRIGRTTLTVSAADATNPRIDVVWVDADGSIGITAGTPAGTPSVPSIGFVKQSLAHVAVAAAATSIVTANITDTRVRLPYDGSQLRDDSIATAHIEDLAVTRAKIEDAAVGTDQIEDGTVTTDKIDDGAVTAAKLATKPVHAVLTAGAETANAITVSIQMKDFEGNNYAAAVALRVEIVKYDGNAIHDDTKYTMASAYWLDPSAYTVTGSRTGGLVLTNGSGVATVTVTDAAPAASHAVWLMVTPLDVPGAPTYVDMPFN